MRVQATVLLSFQAGTLAQAGEFLDDVLARARERDGGHRPRRAREPAGRSLRDAAAGLSGRRVRAERAVIGQRQMSRGNAQGLFVLACEPGGASRSRRPPLPEGPSSTATRRLLRPASMTSSVSSW